MAGGDWIKMRTDLYRDPKVIVIAEMLMAKDSDLGRYVSQNCQRDMTVTRNVTRNVTVGALVSVWGVTRHRGKRDGDDLVMPGVTLDVIDDISDVPGFGRAMERVGWAVQTDKGVKFPRFFSEFNTDPSLDAKSSNAERQRRYREKRNALRNVTVTSQSNARIEKNREENIGSKEPKGDKAKSESQKLPPIPPELDTPEFRTAWSEWLEYRKQRRKPISQAAAKKQFAQLLEWGIAKSVEAIDKSIASDWTGLFEPEQRNGRNVDRDESQRQPPPRPSLTPEQRAELTKVTPGVY